MVRARAALARAVHVDEADYDGAASRLREHGLEVHEEDFGDTKALYVTDPDGHVVELWTWAGASDAR